MTNPPQDPNPQPPQWPQQPPTEPVPGQPQTQWPTTQPMPAGYPQQPPQPQSAPIPPGQQPQGTYPQPPAPPKKGTNAAKVVAGIVAGLIGLCCIGGIIAVATGTDKSTSTSGDTKAAAAPTIAAATTQAAPKLPSGVQGLASWWNGGGKDRAAAIGNDFDELSHEAGNSDYVGLRTTCAQAQKDVEAAQAYGQVPDAQAQSFWAAALASYARASSDCIAGLDTGNMDLVTKSGNEINAGNTSMEQMTARIQEMGNGG